jgi:hypothetical protein
MSDAVAKTTVADGAAFPSGKACCKGSGKHCGHEPEGNDHCDAAGRMVTRTDFYLIPKPSELTLVALLPDRWATS